MREICNLSYATLAQGRNKVELAELDAALVEPTKKKEVYDRINAESMASLGLAPLIPMPPPRNGA